ncbi:hypothetical protein [Georgenia thermotolerans]|uniref:Uncharacterized protein n=1 Tax=Georgenia thermotolerans TaxID=527326 RepID=A0A7J5UQJ9_9MICO|nr:hypothetical protein [Georgenia thermotolerans]KAE8764394.1 hypothetical protein GB883_09245 [Georgenia thermotolerans]
MSYEVHLTRAELPWESAEQPIDLGEWLAYAGARPDLRVNGRIGWADGTEVPVYEYRCAAGYPVSLTWGEGAVAVKGWLTRTPRVSCCPWPRDCGRTWWATTASATPATASSGWTNGSAGAGRAARKNRVAPDGAAGSYVAVKCGL